MDGCCDGVCQLSAFLWPTGGWIIVFMSSRIEAFSFDVSHLLFRSQVYVCQTRGLADWYRGGGILCSIPWRGGSAVLVSRSYPTDVSAVVSVPQWASYTAAVLSDISSLSLLRSLEEEVLDAQVYGRESVLI